MFQESEDINCNWYGFELVEIEVGGCCF